MHHGLVALYVNRFNLRCTAPSRRHNAAGCVVARVVARHRSARRIRTLRDCPCLRRDILRMGAVHFSILFASHRPPSSLVAALSSVADPGVPFGIPRHLLLLPQGLLSSFFSRSTRFRRLLAGYTPLPRRNRVPVYSAKSPPLFSVCGLYPLVLSLARRISRLLF